MPNQRIASLETFLEDKKLEGILVTHPPNIRYFTHFTGEEGLFLALPPEWFLIVDPRYTLRAQSECQGITVLEAPRPLEKATLLIQEKKRAPIGVETAHLSVDLFRKIRRMLPPRHIKSLKDHLDQLRIIKDGEEIESIQKAIDIHTRSLEETLAWVTPETTEREWAIEFEYRAKLHGATRLSFETIVASGPRSAAPHATSEPVPLAPATPVVFDHGVVYNGYCSDETATFFTTSPPKLFTKVYEAVQTAHDAAIEVVRPGIKASDIDAIARKFIEEAGFAEAFTHGTGHGVGLEIHERPTIGPRDTTRLEPGMVFTIEPGIYLPGKGGVRIEDMVLVTSEGCRLLTKRPKFLTVLFE